MMIAEESTKLWERVIGQNDFLRLRLGLGNLPLDADVKYEKYKGDALLCKTYIVDCISKKSVKNTDRPQYYVSNCIPPIMSREKFDRIQMEMARRSSLQKKQTKDTTTELGRYSSKYALTEILICGTCGTAYRRCVLRNDYVEGTNSSPVGYLEGVFVKEEHRNKGYAKELLAACEKWVKNMGCSEFASDCELSNINSHKFHLAMGFDEANRIVCFRKDIR